jgi:hypothetical protein
MIKKMYLIIALVAIIAGSQIQAMGLPAARVAGQAASEAAAKYSAEYGPMLRQKSQQGLKDLGNSAQRGLKNMQLSLQDIRQYAQETAQAILKRLEGASEYSTFKKAAENMHKDIEASPMGKQLRDRWSISLSASMEADRALQNLMKELREMKEGKAEKFFNINEKNVNEFEKRRLGNYYYFRDVLLKQDPEISRLENMVATADEKARHAKRQLLIADDNRKKFSIETELRVLNLYDPKRRILRSSW